MPFGYTRAFVNQINITITGPYAGIQHRCLWRSAAYCCLPKTLLSVAPTDAAEETLSLRYRAD
jgi:hypothetical protein